MNQNEKEFDRKNPNKRFKIHKFLTKELARIKQIGFPEHHVSNIAGTFTKHIINILEEK